MTAVRLTLTLLAVLFSWNDRGAFAAHQGPAADLLVSASVAPSYNYGQTSISIPVTVIKAGGPLTPGGSVKVRLLWSTDPLLGGDTVLWESPAGMYPTDALNLMTVVNGNATVNIPPVVAGNYYMLAVVDPDNEFIESTDLNNLSPSAVTCAATACTKTISGFASACTAGAGNGFGGFSVTPWVPAEGGTWSFATPFTCSLTNFGGSCGVNIEAGGTVAPGLYPATATWKGLCGGTPDTILTFPFTIQVKPAITILTTSPLPDAIVGIPYSFQMTSSGGLQAPVWWIVFASPFEILQGLSLGYTTGVLTGVPEVAGSGGLVVKCDDFLTYQDCWGFFDAQLFCAFTVGTCQGTSFSGAGTPGCSGPHKLSMNQCPKIDAPGFQLFCGAAPPSALGICLIANKALVPPADTFSLGFLLHVDLILATEVYAADFVSDAQGQGTALLPIPNDPSLGGKTFTAQAVWYWASGCPSLPYGLSSSNAVSMGL